MALRRPMLLVCIIALVLGFRCNISRPSSFCKVVSLRSANKCSAHASTSKGNNIPASSRELQLTEGSGAGSPDRHGSVEGKYGLSSVNDSSTKRVTRLARVRNHLHRRFVHCQRGRINVYCMIDASTSDDDDMCFKEHGRELLNTCTLGVWEDRDTLLDDEAGGYEHRPDNHTSRYEQSLDETSRYEHFLDNETSDYEHLLSLVSVCITLTLCRNEHLRQKVMASLLPALKQTTGLRNLIEELIQRITQTIDTKVLSFHRAVDPSQNCSSDDLKKAADHFLSRESGPPNLRETCKTVDGGPEETHPLRATRRLTKATAFLPRRPVTYTVFPASFFPTMGSVSKDKMSHLGCRLASLNSLPASCTVSRTRLAQTGFYYDTTKTNRDARDVHEVTCFSCGVSYSQWKDGDNPGTIHKQLRPDCPHLRESGGQNSMSSLSSNEGASLAPTSASSGYWSMNDGSLDSSTSSQSVSLAGDRPGSDPAATNSAQNWASMAACTESALRGNSLGDLATDCAAIAPSGLTSPAPSTNQATAPRPARQQPPSNQSPFLRPHDFCGIGANGFEDRPPVLMSEAVYPQFSRIKDRQVTFAKWPLSHMFHPDDLVMQGFYYAGYADCIRCFYCGVGLKTWSQDDNVMVEHIRWRPTCGYVLHTKGRQFVNSIKQRIQASSSEGQTTPGNQDGTSTTTTTTATTRQTTPPSSSSTTTTTTTTGVSSSSSSTAASSTTSAASTNSSDSNADASRELLRYVEEEMGFDRATITRAVRQLQQSGTTQIGREQLVDKICQLTTDGEGEGEEEQAAARGGDLQADGPAEQERAQWLANENERLKEKSLCKVCKKAKVGMIFLPCGHIVVCSECGSRMRNCSMCGEYIKATANVFM
ncbi:baculoviral IAP repeat-containing protein 3-like [Babylonia areolata]|uniref:baculoviral IAP repeat-containing protein 3-like n=1 Tax=Babylonia areolata TaxID=304850 RepID=UPI003FD264FF